VKINLGKLLRSAVKIVKENPELALGVAGVIAPKVVKKVAPVLVTVLASKGETENARN